MTDAVPTPSTEVANPDPMVDPTTGKPIGLEDVEERDLVIPRFTIIGKEAKFEDSLTKERHEELTVIILGQVKQRVLWPADVDDANKPMCKSYDWHTGVADPAQYPWDASGFKAADYPGESPELPCESCKLKEWDTHPTRSIPWCTEQWVFPLITEEGAPALLTIQRSGIKAAKAYVTAFAGRKEPFFTAYTRLRLSAQKRGSVEFAVPIFERTGDVDEKDFPRLAQQLLHMREFLQTPRTFAEEKPPEPETPAPVADSGEIPF